MDPIIVVLNDKPVDFRAATIFMDDVIREQLHESRDWDDDAQAFMDAYAAAHLRVFGTEFVVN